MRKRWIWVPLVFIALITVLALGLVVKAQGPYLVQTVDNLLFNPWNPWMNFAGTMGFRNRTGVTVATLTDQGALAVTSIAGISNTPVSFSSGIDLTPYGTPLYVGQGDLVIGRQTMSQTGPSGPGPGMATIRVRQSLTVPGYCNVVIAAGNTFNQEYPIAVIINGKATVDIPAGLGGC